MKKELSSDQLKMIQKVSDMFDYEPSDVGEANVFVKKIEGTEAYWYLVARLITNHTELKEKVADLERRLEKTEEILGKMGNSFERNEYGF